MRIDGQVAVVTGGGSGLGRGTARMLVAAGARVAALDAQPQGVQALAAELGEAVLPITIDVRDGPQMEAAFERVAAHWGEARILVNCAGVLGVGKLLKRDGKARELDAFRRVIDINLVGTFNSIRVFAARIHAAQALDGGERGVIVNTASVAAYEALSAQAAYGSSKGGVAGMTLPLARELARHGIRARPVRRRDRRLPDLVPVRRRNRWLHRFAPASQEHRCQRGRLAARDPGRRDRQPPRRHHWALAGRGNVTLRGDLRRRRVLAYGCGEGTARGDRRNRGAPRVPESAAPTPSREAGPRKRLASQPRKISA